MSRPSGKMTRVAGESPDAETREDAQRRLAEVAAEMDGMGEPRLPRLLADDVTPEALGGLIATHGWIGFLRFPSRPSSTTCLDTTVTGARICTSSAPLTPASRQTSIDVVETLSAFHGRCWQLDSSFSLSSWKSCWRTRLLGRRA